MKIMRTEIFDERGFDIIDNAFDEEVIDNLKHKLARLKLDETAKQRQSVAFGVRNLLNVAPFVREFADSTAVRKLVEPIAGRKARVVRAIFFDKTPQANWKVPFHQDLTIAVKERKAAPDFAIWTSKANVPHVQPPAPVLENIVTLRAHLDETDESNGALRIVAGSHRFGKLSAAQIEKLKNAGEIVNCSVGRGGAMLMRPLLLHASSAATNASHRRVLHFEFSSEELPEGLEWFGS